MPFDLKQVIQIIQSGNWFTCRFITADQSKQSGGEVITLKKCRIARNQRLAVNAMKPGAAGHQKHSDPLHNYHFTRNLELENGQMRKVHPLLIFELNGQPVL